MTTPKTDQTALHRTFHKLVMAVFPGAVFISHDTIHQPKPAKLPANPPAPLEDQDRLL